jgi:hypothetical protein
LTRKTWSIRQTSHAVGGARASLPHLAALRVSRSSTLWILRAIECRHAGCRLRHACLPATVLQRSQKIENVLLLTLCELLEVIDHTVGLRSVALMLSDRRQQIGGPTVVQEENALSQSP